MNTMNNIDREYNYNSNILCFNRLIYYAYMLSIL